MEPRYDINEDVKRQVLAATDLVALIGAVTELKKAGSSWKGRCPFHNEKTGSFHVHPEKGFYYCFGCGAKGDAISFVRETERLDFIEAVVYLARRAGVSLPSRKTGTRTDRAKESGVAESLAAASQFFWEQLEKSTVAREFLEKRGLSMEEGRQFGFGFAADGWENLKTILGRRFPESVLVEAGLLQQNPESGRVYDRFRNRLTIEIRDPRGEVLGFGARAFGDDQPKYLNSPESTRFSKGKLLYGLDQAREAIRKSGQILLVEGYFDRIAFARAGLDQAVASMGTSLTPAQVDLMSRFGAEVVVAYDGDPPGLVAAEKAFGMLLEKDLKVRHLVLPEGHDPDSYLKAYGGEALAGSVVTARTLIQSLSANLPAAEESPEKRAERIDQVAGILRRTASPVLRFELLSSFAKVAGVPLRVLGLGPAGNRTDAPTVVPGGETREASLPESERSVLQMMLAWWPSTVRIVERVPSSLFSHPAAVEIIEALKQQLPRPEPLDFSEWSTHLGKVAERLVMGLVFAKPGIVDGEPGEPDISRLRKPLLSLQIKNLEERSRELQAVLERARGESDSQQTDQLLQEKSRLTQDITKLKQELRRPKMAMG
jgi:DNA primase